MQDRLPKDEEFATGGIYRDWTGSYFKTIKQSWEYKMTLSNIINIEYPSCKETSEIHTTTLGKNSGYERIL